MAASTAVGCNGRFRIRSDLLSFPPDMLLPNKFRGVRVASLGPRLCRRMHLLYPRAPTVVFEMCRYLAVPSFLPTPRSCTLWVVERPHRVWQRQEMYFERHLAVVDCRTKKCLRACLSDRRTAFSEPDSGRGVLTGGIVRFVCRESASAMSASGFWRTYPSVNSALT